MAMGKFSERGDSPPRSRKCHRPPPVYTRARRRSSPSRSTLHRLGNLLSVWSDMLRGEAMKRSGWRQGLGDLVRDVTRVLFVYALVLQTLAPVAIARAEASNGFANYGVLCVAMVGDSAEKPANLPLQIVHNCLSCCLGSPVAILSAPAELPRATSYGLLRSPPVPKSMVWLARGDVPPPQRAPPVRA